MTATQIISNENQENAQLSFTDILVCVLSKLSRVICGAYLRSACSTDSITYHRWQRVRSQLRKDSAFFSHPRPEPESKICEKPDQETLFIFGSSRSLRDKDRVYGGDGRTCLPQLLDRRGHDIFCPPNIL